MNIIDRERIDFLNKKEFCKGTYVLYWMNHSFRVKHNHALTFAIHIANTLKLPLLVFTGISEPSDERGRRHYSFMLEGIREVEEDLRKIFIKYIVWIIDSSTGVINLSSSAAAVITDTGFLHESRQQSMEIAEAINCSFISVDANTIVPVKKASDKEEYSAATFRPKIQRKLDYYLKPPPELKPELSSIDIRFRSIELDDPDHIFSELSLSTCENLEKNLTGGHSHAARKLGTFISRKLDFYSEKRNDPSLNMSSQLSPYLHYGQISPIEIAIKVLDTESPGKDSFLEELIVRRELSFNYVYYNSEYDNLKCLPNWAFETLIAYDSYPREVVYTKSDFEKCRTHDRYWNAAQHELLSTGMMHGYMRMYWGKKIIEWSDSPDTAFGYMTYLNNKYALDGNDPNSYAGIAWCFGKHDRPWKERPVFGKVRYMNDRGLKRKFDIEGYVKRVKYRPDPDE